jgi:hypothetical protein
LLSKYPSRKAIAVTALSNGALSSIDAVYTVDTSVGVVPSRVYLITAPDVSHSMVTLSVSDSYTPDTGVIIGAVTCGISENV